MAMSVGSGGEEETALSEINTTPLVDVMLVLLIIFLITIPAVLQAPHVTLPNLAYEPTVTKPENVLLSVRGGPNGTCEVFWENTPVTSTELLSRGQEKLRVLLENIGGPQNVTEDNFPEVHIRGDVDTPYQCIGGVIYTMQFAGFQKIGFISQPSGNELSVRRL